VNSFNPSEKYYSMGRIIPYIMDNKNMFETTNQFTYPLVNKHIEHGPVEIVDLPIKSMVDLSSSLCM
jgi:hypothetical protein